MNAGDLGPTVRTFDLAGATVADAVRAKGGRTISLCIPCKDEAATIGPLVAMLRADLVDTRYDDVALVDELIVVDDGSVDDTARLAGDAGATVVPIGEVHAAHGPGRGKGNAIWASLVASTGDFVVWCDADVTTVEGSWVSRLVQPLLLDDTVALMKAMYDRPTAHGGGGRTTELVARPLLSMCMPSLWGLHQPLGGEYAARRSAIDALSLPQGWGVEVAMLIDLTRALGPAAIGQVDVGIRRHRHQPLDRLGTQAAEVAATIIARGGHGTFVGEAPALVRADATIEALNLEERPPIRELREHP